MRKALLLLLVSGIVVAVILGRFLIEPDSHNDSLTVMGEDSSNLAAYTELATAFTEESGVNVRFEAETFENSITKADSDFSAGSGRYDIVLQYNFSLVPYVQNHYVAEVADVFSPSLVKQQHLDSGMFENALRETCFYYKDPSDHDSEPKQFGFPFAANTMLMVYNKTLFENEQYQETFKAQTGLELAVPNTWDEYVRVAEFFGGTENCKGVCLQGANGGWLYYELCNYLFSLGTGTSRKERGWERTRNLCIATPQNVNALTTYKRLHSVTSGDFFDVDAAKQRQIMKEGKTAMAIMWSDYVYDLWKSKDGARFGYAPIPGGISGLAGGAFYINRTSKRTQAATEFVLFALEEANQEELLLKGLCSPLRSAYTEKVFKAVPYARALYDSLERGVFMFEAGADSELISTSLTTHVQRYVRGEIDAKEALQTAEQESMGQPGSGR